MLYDRAVGATVTTADIEQITRLIVREFDPVKVILFGSRARGDARPDSDVDLLVVLDEGADKHAGAVALQRCVAGFHAPKDIIVTTPGEIRRRGHIAGTVLRPALREGVTLYRRSTVAGNREEALRWLKLAKSDLALARVVLANDDLPPYHACYHAQQAAEKALKAGLTLMDIDPPRTHSLDSLRDTFPGGWDVQEAFPELAELTDWNAQGRYPGDWPEATAVEAGRMVALAEAVLASVVEDLQSRGLEVPGSA